MNSVENVENFSSFMAGVFLTRREISCSELSYLMNDYSIKMNSCIVGDDDEFYMFNNFIHFDNKKIFVKEAYDDYVNINNRDICFEDFLYGLTSNDVKVYFNIPNRSNNILKIKTKVS